MRNTLIQRHRTERNLTRINVTAHILPEASTGELNETESRRYSLDAAPKNDISVKFWNNNCGPDETRREELLAVDRKHDARNRMGNDSLHRTQE